MSVVNLAERRAKLRFSNAAEIIDILHSLHENMRVLLAKDEAYWFQKFENEQGKKLLAIDHVAEQEFSKAISDRLSDAIIVAGEESLPKTGIDYSNSKSLHILCDMIDGTDLLVRGMSNWCSAFIAFEPASRQMLAAHVYVVDRGVDLLYSAFADKEGAHLSAYRTYVFPLNDQEFVKFEREDLELEFVADDQLYSRSFYEPSSARRLEEAGIFSYGQKLKNFRPLSDFLLHESVAKRIQECEDLRIYNLAGNPALCRMVEGKADLVFDLAGQAAHDVLPGAFIALKSGASMYVFEGEMPCEARHIQSNDLIEFALRPCSQDTRLKYVVASSEKLALDFISLLQTAGVVA